MIPNMYCTYDILRYKNSSLFQLLNYIEGHGIIAGGYAKFLSDPNEPKYKPSDIDVWPLSKSEYECTCNYFSILKNVEEHGFIKYFESDMSINYKVPDEYDLGCKCPQVIKPSKFLFDTPIELFDTFDISVAMVSLVIDNGNVYGYMHRETFTHLENMVCTISNISNPLLALVRMQKYQNQGYKFFINDLMKVIINIHSNPGQVDAMRDIANKEENKGMSNSDLYKLWYSIKTVQHNKKSDDLPF